MPLALCTCHQREPSRLSLLLLPPPPPSSQFCPSFFFGALLLWFGVEICRDW